MVPPRPRLGPTSPLDYNFHTTQHSKMVGNPDLMDKKYLGLLVAQYPKSPHPQDILWLGSYRLPVGLTLGFSLGLPTSFSVRGLSKYLTSSRHSNFPSS